MDDYADFQRLLCQGKINSHPNFGFARYRYIFEVFPTVPTLDYLDFDRFLKAKPTFFRGADNMVMVPYRYFLFSFSR